MSKTPALLHSAWRIVRVGAPVIVILAVMILVIAWLAGMFLPKIQPGEVAEDVRRLADQPTDVVHEVTKEYVEESVGSLKAASRTVVSAKILASIVELAVSAGDEVQAGDLLIRLDDQALQAQLKQAEQASKAAVSTEREAQSQFRRTEQLVKDNAASRAELEEMTRRLEVAQANVSQAEQAVQEARVMLSYTLITAPKNGRIVDRLAEPGDTARPGEPLLVLYDATSLRLEAPVPEQLAVTLKVGDKLSVYIDALQRTVTATLDEIVPQADAPSRSFLVKASIDRSEDLYEGMFGRLLIPAGERRHLCLATDAVQRIGQLEFVDIVGQDDQLQRRLITTGRLGMPGRVEVLSGLEAGERVVLHGDASASQGAAADDAATTPPGTRTPPASNPPQE